jgi:CRP-like cAMP-binding protein
MASPEQLKTFVPINSLGADSLDELAAKARVETLSPRKVLFEEGDTDGDTVYLIAGEVALSSSRTGVTRAIVAGSDEARYALAHLKPRQYRGTARTEIMIVRLDSALLDRLITMEQSAQAGGIEVVEFESDLDSEWMLRMLRSDTFQQLPPSNFNALFHRLEPIAVKGGQVIIRQGDPGDYYYLIRSGKAMVTRKGPGGKVTVLGELGEGDGFGEEALLSGAPRNATVLIRSDGMLMRLAKQDFDELLKEPLVKWVGQNELRSLVHAGAGLIDVRLEDEFARGSITGSVNVPLYILRLKSASLDHGRKYVVCCDTGNRSCAAAFLLAQRGFDVHVLRGGLGALAHAA